MLKFLVCDDNKNTLNSLSKMLEDIFIKNDLNAKIVYKAKDDNDVLTYVKENPVDVFILDIQLKSNMNGLDLAKQIRKNNKNSYFIFVTGHSEFVFMAYKIKTFDYLCKPISKESLEDTILRLFDDIYGNTSCKKYIKLDNKNTLIDENEVDFLKSDGMKVIFQTNSNIYETYSSFAKLQQQLPNNFVRCHKSFIVNIKNIAKLEPASNLIYFKNNQTCDIGPKYKENFLKEVRIL